MYKITEEIYAKLYKEAEKSYWKLSTRKPDSDFVTIKTMTNTDELKVMEIESEFQADANAKKKEIMKLGFAKTAEIMTLIESKCDFSNSIEQFQYLKLEEVISLFYEWFAFNRLSEEEKNVFL